MSFMFKVIAWVLFVVFGLGTAFGIWLTLEFAPKQAVQKTNASVAHKQRIAGVVK